MLENKYSIEHWKKTMARAVKSDTQGYALGLIGDVRNREFGTVVLAPEVMDWAAKIKHVARARAASAIYVAVTRARHRLFLPEGLRGWIEDLDPA